MAKSVKIAIIGDASGLKGAVQESEGVLKGFGDKLKGFGAGLVAGFGLSELKGAVSGAIGMASDLNEALSKNQVVFGDGAASIAKSAKDAYKTVGLSEKAYAELAGTVGVLGKSAGMAGTDLAGFGQEVIQRASDIGSFNNAASSDVVEAWGAAMRGEMEPMRRFGVLLDDAALRNEALSMGLVKNTKEALTPQTKALAANSLIMKQTSDAAGDFARTSDGLANKQRILKAKIDNLKTTIGAKLLPVFSSVVGFISDKIGPAFEWLGRTVTPIFKEIVGGFRAFVAAFKAGDGDITSSGFPGFMEQAANTARKAFDGIRRVVVPVFKEIVGVVRAFVASFRAGDGDITSSGLAGYFERLGFIFRKVFDWIVNTGLPAFREGVAGAFTFIRDKVLPIVGKIVGGIIDGLSAALDWAIEHWPQFRQVIAKAFDWIKTNVVPVVQRVVAAIVQFLSTAVAWVQTNWPAFQAAVMAVVQWIMDNVVPAIQAVVQFIVEKFQALISWVQTNWGAISEAIGHVVNAVWAVIKWLINVVKGAWEMWGDNLLNLVKITWEQIKTIIDAAVGIVKGIIETVVAIINGDWDKAWNAAKGIVSSAWEGIKGTFETIAKYALETLKIIWDPLKEGLDTVWEGIKGTLNTVVEFVTGLPKKISDAAVGMWDGIKTAFRSAINWLIDAWNGLELKLPEVDTHIPGIGKVGGFSLGTPDIPRLADGGIVKSPTLALIGERGPEAVVPLSGGGGGMGGSINVTVHAGMGANGHAIGEQIVSELRKYERRNGTGWRAA